jgi:hypothetical protein
MEIFCGFCPVTCETKFCLTINSGIFRSAKPEAYCCSPAAELFHTKTLDSYYHPHSYAFYGDDPHHMTYGSIRWVASHPDNTSITLTTTSIQQAKLLDHTHDGGRTVKVDGKATWHFAPAQQDERGDDTVPQQSGSGPAGKVRQLFATRGFGHKGSFKSADMLLLTQY